MQPIIATEPRIVKEAQTLAVDTVYDVDLPRHGRSIAYVDLFIKGTANHGVDPSAAGLFYKLIKKIELVMDSKNVHDRMSGEKVFQLDSLLAGARVEHAAPVATAGSSFARLRLWIIDPKAALGDQRRGARDIGKLTNFKLRFETGALTDVWADGTLAMASMDYTVIFGDIPGVVIDGDVVNVFRLNSYTMNGTDEEEKWQEEGAELKRIAVMAFDGTTLSDSVVTDLGLRLGGKTNVIPKMAWNLHRSRTIDYTGLDADLLATGVTFLSLSEKGQPRIFLGQRQAVTPLFKGTADKVISFVLQQHHGRKSFFGF